MIVEVVPKGDNSRKPGTLRAKAWIPQIGEYVTLRIPDHLVEYVMPPYRHLENDEWPYAYEGDGRTDFYVLHVYDDGEPHSLLAKGLEGPLSIDSWVRLPRADGNRPGDRIRVSRSATFRQSDIASGERDLP